MDERHARRIRPLFRRLLSVVFKSGANAFHGTAEDRYTSGNLRHRHYLEQSRITSPFDYHEWGATASGPIIRDKTFWFVGFQQHYEKLAETVTTTVPSPEMLAGDFSFGGKGLPIYDPDTLRRDDARQLDPRPIPGKPNSGQPVRSGRQQSARIKAMGAAEPAQATSPPMAPTIISKAISRASTNSSATTSRWTISSAPSTRSSAAIRAFAIAARNVPFAV